MKLSSIACVIFGANFKTSWLTLLCSLLVSSCTTGSIENQITPSEQCLDETCRSGAVCTSNQECDVGARCVNGMCYTNQCEEGDERSCSTECGEGTQYCLAGIWRSCIVMTELSSGECAQGGDGIAGAELAGDDLAGVINAGEQGGTQVGGATFAGDQIGGEVFSGALAGESAGTEAGEEPTGGNEMLPPVCTLGEVNASNGLNLRPSPNTINPPVLLIPSRGQVRIFGDVSGESISGNPTWLEVAYQDQLGFVSEQFVDCLASDQPGSYQYNLPFECGLVTTVTQGNGGEISHAGRDLYAFDFLAETGTAVVAMREGQVTQLNDNTRSGDPCYNGGGQSCRDAANYVILTHLDQTRTVYLHLNSVSVSLYEHVGRGEVIGQSGNTGYSTGPHLHVSRQLCTSLDRFCDTVPLGFEELQGAGVPELREVVQSGNCR